MRISIGKTKLMAKTQEAVSGVLLLASIAFIISACGSTDDGIRVFVGEDFYDPPDPLPNGEPGDIIWAEPLKVSIGMGWKILYYSRSLDQREIRYGQVAVFLLGGRRQSVAESGSGLHVYSSGLVCVRSLSPNAVASRSRRRRSASISTRANAATSAW